MLLDAASSRRRSLPSPWRSPRCASRRGHGRSSRRRAAGSRGSTTRCRGTTSLAPSAQRPFAATSASRSRSNEARADRAVIVQLLKDFRDVAGAEEAIYLALDARPRVASMPAIWSSEGDATLAFQHHRVGAAGAVVRGAGRGADEAHEETSTSAAAPIQRGETLMGVLSLTHRTGLGLERRARCVSGCRGWPTSSARCRSWSTCGGAIRAAHAAGPGAAGCRPAAPGRQDGRGAGAGVLRDRARRLGRAWRRAGALGRPRATAGEIAFATEGTGLRAPAPLDGASIVARGMPHGQAAGPRGHADGGARTRHLRGAAGGPASPAPWRSSHSCGMTACWARSCWRRARRRR